MRVILKESGGMPDVCRKKKNIKKRVPLKQLIIHCRGNFLEIKGHDDTAKSYKNFSSFRLTTLHDIRLSKLFIR
jgi:hypothetical protein